MSSIITRGDTTDIPNTFKTRDRKTVIALPNGSRRLIRREATVDNSIIKVIARGFRWKQLLDSGTYSTINDLAAAEKINPSYVSRIPRLAYLAPKVTQAILDGKQPEWLTLKGLLLPHLMAWPTQERGFLSSEKSG